MLLNGNNGYFALLKGKGYEHKGEYDATAVYEHTGQRIDCFSYLGATYYTIKTAPVGTLPTNTEYFGIMASSNGYTKAEAEALFATKDDAATKTNLDASNLTEENVASWQEKLGCENVDVLYDISSTDSAINWGYTSGINVNTTINIDISKYKRVVAYLKEWGTITLDLTNPNYNRATNSTFTVYADSYLHTYMHELKTNSSRSTLTFEAKTYATSGHVADTTQTFIRKIEGVY